MEDKVFEARHRNELLRTLSMQDAEYIQTLNVHDLQSYLLERVTWDMSNITNKGLEMLIEAYDKDNRGGHR